jgi:uncharacterized damage-inducible protein DinB
MSVNQLDDVTRLFRYTWWAEDQFIAAAKALSAEQQDRELGGSFPSVRQCLAHLAASHLIWFRRWHGLPGRPLPEGWPAASMDALLEQWPATRRDQEGFVASLDLAELDRPVNFMSVDQTTLTLPLGETLRHVVNHSTYHRGQIATFLRMLGVTPPATDLVLFYVEERAAR